MTNQRRARSSETGNARDALLVATQGLIERSGLGAATSRAIADAAEQNLGAITYYFGSKDKLVDEALIQTATRLIQPVIEALQGDETPANKLAISMKLLQNLLSENRGQLAGYVHALAASTHEPLVQQSLQSLHNTIINALSHVLQSQRDANLIPDWVDPQSMAELFVTLAKGLAVSGATGSSDEQIALVGQQFAALLLAARPHPQNF